ncbi:FecR domain-containing protein [Agriterribacter sp.]|uniref:FecR domain-containing protein n=1 Tax=Agriterribacter sp. TaxID=2821509 RepID=UPI002CD47419|nr:FecR domain-containing protein [Agriterribacter sp.]HRP57169.1 FecR domain-containing protein [Agriterribacter sp.]
MIHQSVYVKELIKKYIEGAITGIELERLKACWKIYEEDELLNMTAEVLYATGKQAPGNALEGWEPDLTKIVNNAQSIQRNKNMLAYGKPAAAACLLLLLMMAVNHFILNKWPGSNATGECSDTPSRNEIPRSEFACTVRWGDTTALTPDSNAAWLVAHVNNFRIRRQAPGILTLTRLAETLPVDTTRGWFMEVFTGTRLQYIIQLPGGVSVHLNAGSSLKLPFMTTGSDTCYIQLNGEAYIKMQEEPKPGRLIVETSNSQLQTTGGEFSVSAFPGYTKATTVSGRIIAFSRQGIHKKEMDCSGNQAVIKSYAKANNAIADSIFFRRNADVGEALVWTKATRNYRNASLRQFVADMSRWCGFTVESLNCIPEHLRINTSICYRASREQVYSEIRKAGITVYEKGERISFCNPAKQSDTPSSRTAFRKPPQ